MKPAYFEVLSPAEIREIDAASLDILAHTGVRVGLKRARDTFREAGAQVDEAAGSVRLPESLVREAVARAPRRFTPYGADPGFQRELGSERSCFAGSAELLGTHAGRYGIDVTLVDTSDLRAVREALRPETRLVYVETPANPILRLADIAGLTELVHGAGARLAVDSTFATPALQNPPALGADLVLHSMTKYLGGHGDALGGIVLGAREQIDEIRRGALIHFGGAMSPMNAWLINRGLATLSLRMRKHEESALAVARLLEGHPKVGRVFYPGPESHPRRELARRQMSGAGGMVTAQMDMQTATEVVKRVRVFTCATSLGDVQSLLFYYPMEFYVDVAAYLSSAQKRDIREWTGEGIMRLSVGLEDAEDIVADLDQALGGAA